MSCRTEGIMIGLAAVSVWLLAVQPVIERFLNWLFRRLDRE